jgi:hypothetical protein
MAELGAFLNIPNHVLSNQWYTKLCLARSVVHQARQAHSTVAKSLSPGHTYANQIKSLIRSIQRRAWDFIIVNYIPELNLYYRLSTTKET